MSSDRKATESRSWPGGRILQAMSVHDPSGTADPAEAGASGSGPRECVRTLESCAFIWFFDLDRRRFRRAPVEVTLHVPAPATAWTDYFHLQVDEDPPVFRVGLNADQTWVLRSSYHAGPCLLCRRRRPGAASVLTAPPGGCGGPDAPSAGLTEGRGRGSV